MEASGTKLGGMVGVVGPMTQFLERQPLRQIELPHRLDDEVSHGIDHIEVLCSDWQYVRPDQTAASLNTQGETSTAVRKLACCTGTEPRW